MRVLLLGLMLGSVLFIFGCGSKKDEVQIMGELPPVVSGERPQIPVNPLPRERERDGTRTQVQIACESIIEMGIFLPNSQQSTGTRVREYISKKTGEEMHAPTILGIRNRVIRLLFSLNGKTVISDYDTVSRTEGKRIALPVKSAGSSSVYAQLGFSRPKLAAAAPDRTHFALSAGAGYEVRLLENPGKAVASWKLAGKLANPRWEPLAEGQSEVFFDRIDGKTMAQVWAEIDSANRLMRSHSIPKAVNGHQVGLRRYDEQHLIWLEWSARKSVVRIWHTASGEVQSFPLESQAYGPGLALLKEPNGSKSVVLESRDGLDFYSVSPQGLTLQAQQNFPELVERYIKEGKHDWKPGAVYSVAGDSQLLTVLPAIWGKMLFAVDEGRFFRQLGHFACFNPDFYPEF